MPPRRLTKLKIAEISDCPRGANPFADVLLIKSDNSGGSVTLSDVLKALPGLSEAERAEVAKAVTVAKADPLADLPADHPIRKQIADAEAKATLLAKRLDEMAEREEMGKALSIAKALPHVTGGTDEGAAKLAATLRKVGKLDEAAAAEVLDVLKTMEPALAKAERTLGKMSGAKVGEDATAGDKLSAIAKDIAKAERIPYAAAFVKASDLNPELAAAAVEDN